MESPKLGWIHEIREGLGQSLTQLAKRLGVTKQTLRQLEESEKKGTITVRTLTRAAEALGCRVKMILVPERPLDELLKRQALEQASRIICRTELHMNLEKQGTDRSYQEQQVQELADELVRTLDRRLWDTVL